jgi:hypothetical protein
VCSQENRKKIDVDLTALSDVMQQAMLLNIVTKPENYLGKTMKIEGEYDSWCPGNVPIDCSHFILFSDAAACCKTGFEFRCNDGKTNNYPEKDAKIRIVGVISSYKMSGRSLYYLATDDVVIVK